MYSGVNLYFRPTRSIENACRGDDFDNYVNWYESILFESASARIEIVELAG